jgi:hypothetical protein
MPPKVWVKVTTWVLVPGRAWSRVTCRASTWAADMPNAARLAEIQARATSLAAPLRGPVR